MTPRDLGVEQQKHALDHSDSFRVIGRASPTADLTSSADLERRVVVVEVGPRDGLQNESNAVPTEIKIAVIDALSAAGLPVIEATSFVSPKAVPQLADAGDVMAGITRHAGTRYLALVPNERGLERAVASGVDAIAVFTAATEQFAAANVGTSIAGTFDRFAPVAAAARRHGIWMRGYVSVAFGCPYAGAVPVGDVVAVAERLHTLGCDEICLADTIGAAKPSATRELLTAVAQSLPLSRLALHFHDTSGVALQNVEVGLDGGVRIFDAAAGGLGGCPFAPGAPGNLATERLLDRLGRLGFSTAVDPERVAAAISLLRPYVARLAASAA